MMNDLYSNTDAVDLGIIPGATPGAKFNGDGYDAEKDHARLNGQIRRIYDLMHDGKWRTLEMIATATGDPPASVSAQLRHMRKPRFGGHTVEKRRVVGTSGLWEYRLQ